MKKVVIIIAIIFSVTQYLEAGLSYHRKANGYPFILSKPKGYVKGTAMPLIVFYMAKV
ncbi:MAG: hypothetical protein ACO34C_05920 [Candidatus Kapaibacteriota bacterium]